MFKYFLSTVPGTPETWWSVWAGSRRQRVYLASEPSNGQCHQGTSTQPLLNTCLLLHQEDSFLPISGEWVDLQLPTYSTFFANHILI